MSTMIDVMVAEMSEPGRLRRGRQYARQGAVGPLTVAAGMVSAVVQGSVPEPYVATARVKVVEPSGARLVSLVPSRREVRMSCTCPDDSGACKHAIAMMAAFSERLAYDGSLFVRWRTGGEVSVDDPFGGGADGPGDRSAAAPSGLDAAQVAALRAYLAADTDDTTLTRSTMVTASTTDAADTGATDVGVTDAGVTAATGNADVTWSPGLPVPLFDPLPDPVADWDEVWAQMLTSATAVLRGSYRTPRPR